MKPTKFECSACGKKHKRLKNPSDKRFKQGIVTCTECGKDVCLDCVEVNGFLRVCPDCMKNMTECEVCGLLWRKDMVEPCKECYDEVCEDCRVKPYIGGGVICINCGTECEVCGDTVEETYTCERCGNEACLECTADNYPYNVTYCENCEEIWEALMDEHNFIH